MGSNNAPVCQAPKTRIHSTDTRQAPDNEPKLKISTSKTDSDLCYRSFAIKHNEDSAKIWKNLQKMLAPNSHSKPVGNKDSQNFKPSFFSEQSVNAALNRPLRNHHAAAPSQKAAAGSRTQVASHQPSHSDETAFRNGGLPKKKT